MIPTSPKIYSQVVSPRASYFSTASNGNNSSPFVTHTNYNFLIQSIKGESRVEITPFQKNITEFVTQEIVEIVPKEKKIIDYYAIEHQTEYIPKVIQEKYVGIEMTFIQLIEKLFLFNQLKKEQSIRQSKNKHYLLKQFKFNPYFQSTIANVQSPMIQKTRAFSFQTPAFTGFQQPRLLYQSTSPQRFISRVGMLSPVRLQ